MEFDTLSPQRASDAFTSHDDRRYDISEVFSSGDLEAYSVEYETTFQKHWVDIHRQHGQESDAHHLLKLVLADFFHELGHDIGTPIPEEMYLNWRTIHREEMYYCFEREFSNGRADVAVLDEETRLIGEVGNCNPRKLTRGGLEGQQSAFVLLPYGWSDRDVEIGDRPESRVNNVEPHRQQPVKYDILSEIAVFIKPEHDLSACLFPSTVC